MRLQMTPCSLQDERQGHGRRRQVRGHRQAPGRPRRLRSTSAVAGGALHLGGQEESDEERREQELPAGETSAGSGQALARVPEGCRDGLTTAKMDGVAAVNVPKRAEVHHEGRNRLATA